jgi:hypothetical protein
VHEILAMKPRREEKNFEVLSREKRLVKAPSAARSQSGQAWLYDKDETMQC